MKGARNRLTVWPALASGLPLASVFALGLLAACGPPDRAERPGPDPTDEEEPPWEPPVDTDEEPPLDTGFPPPENLPPRDVLYIAHDGLFTVSGSPASELTGTLRVRERLNAPLPPLPLDDEEEEDTDVPPEEPDEEEELAGCDVSYTLTGALPDLSTGCGPCDFVLDVTFTVTEGAPNTCLGPDTPRNGETWRFGYSSSEQRMFLNYHGTGVYLPWYQGEPAVVDEQAMTRLFWTTDLGLVVEDN